MVHDLAVTRIRPITLGTSDLAQVVAWQKEKLRRIGRIALITLVFQAWLVPMGQAQQSWSNPTDLGVYLSSSPAAVLDLPSPAPVGGAPFWAPFRPPLAVFHQGVNNNLWVISSFYQNRWDLPQDMGAVTG